LLQTNSSVADTYSKTEGSVCMWGGWLKRYSNWKIRFKIRTPPHNYNLWTKAE